MIAGIVALERNQGIGFNGQMPWPHLKGDMKSFVHLATDTIEATDTTPAYTINEYTK